MTPRTPTPASPPWPPRPSRQSRASRTRTRRRLRLNLSCRRAHHRGARRFHDRAGNDAGAHTRHRIRAHLCLRPNSRTRAGFGTHCGPNPRICSARHPRGLPRRFRNRGLLPRPASAPAVDLSPLRRRHARHRRRVLLDRPRTRYHRCRAKPRKLPLRYTQAGERHEVTVRIRRNTTGGLGAAWAIDKVEALVE